MLLICYFLCVIKQKCYLILASVDLIITAKNSTKTSDAVKDASIAEVSRYSSLKSIKETDTHQMTPVRKRHYFDAQL